ncbi:MAG: beta-glucosidase [Mycoplasmatales bacterium]
MEIEQLLKKMSVKEKVGQLNQKLYGWEVYQKTATGIELTSKFKEHCQKYDYSIGAIYGILRADPWSGKNYDNGLTAKEAKEALKLVSDYLNDNSQHQIRPFIVEETPHGHQGLDSKLLPPNIAIGASFNPKLYAKAVEKVSSEMENLGVDVGLFVGLDIAKDQRWGRVEETFGEDPYLAAMLTKEIVKATKNYNFIACLKHFAAQGAPYLGLNSGAVNIGERELREIHLPPIKAAIEENVKMVMAAYNEIDGIPCHANKKLLTKILREELGFSGVVMADGLALDRLISKSCNIHEAGRMALTAGVNLSLWDETFDNLVQAVEQGIVSEKLLDKAVREILSLKKELNLIKESFKTNKLNANQSINSHNETNNYALELAEESIILEKNHANYLPFTPNAKILVIGDNALDLYAMLGDYTPVQKPATYLTIFEALKKDFQVVDHVTYHKFLQNKIALENYDKVIVIMGGSSRRDFGSVFDDNGAIINNENLVTDCGENVDVASIALKDIQRQVAKKLWQNNCQFLSIILAGRAYALEEVSDYATAIIQAFYPGVYGGVALSKIISGEVNPSGKNPLTILKSAAYNQYTYNSKQDFRKEEYVDQKQIIAYPFGYGLSYATFIYQNLQITQQEKLANNLKVGQIEVTVTVQNLSNLAGKEVIQVYVKKENTLITKRRRELIAFKKILFLAQETKTINFTIDYQDLTIYNETYEQVLEPNVYTFIIGDGENTYCSKQLTITN